jgi:hypothetical protein
MAAPYGIDAIVQQRVDANRNNPGALANNYQKNQQLVDLLALQKLKAEKEAAARDIQMKMQGNPQTIMQQKEQQVMDMTKQELAQRVGMAGENQEAQMKARMNGIAGMPAPNMQGMAEGGIVPRMGYAEGGITSTSAQRSIEDRAIELMRLSPELDFNVAYRIASTQAKGPVKAAIASGNAENARNLDMADGGRPGEWDERNVQMMLGEDLQPRRPPMPQPAAPQGIAGATPPFFPEQLPEGGGGGISAMLAAMGGGGDINVQDRQAPQVATPNNTAMRTRIEDTLDMAPDTVRQAAGERFQELTNVDDLLTQQQDVTTERQALFDQINDPQRQKRERLKAFLTGAANRTSLGSAMAGATAASTNLRNEQESAQTEQLNMRRAEFEKMVEANRELGMKQSEAEDNAVDQLISQQSTATQASVELSRQEQQVAVENMSSKLKQQGLDQDLAIAAATLDNDLTRAMISANGRGGSDDADAEGLTPKDKIEVLKMVAEDPEYMAAYAALTAELGEQLFTAAGRARAAELKEEYFNRNVIRIDTFGPLQEMGQ